MNTRIPFGRLCRFGRRIRRRLDLLSTMRESPLEIVETVAHRAKRRLVVLAIDGDGASRVLDSGRALSEGHHRPAAQQPDQTCSVIAAQSSVAWRWLIGDWRQPEQVFRRPAKRARLLTPL